LSSIKSLLARCTFGFIFLVTPFLSFSQIDSSLWKSIELKRKVAYQLQHRNIDSALLVINQTLELVQQPIDSLIYSKLLNTKGHIHSAKGDYDLANSRYLEAAKIREKFSDKSLLGSVYHSLANLNYRLHQYDETVAYAQQAIVAYKRKSKYFRQVANCYNLIGVTFYDRQQYDSAIYHYIFGINHLDRNESSQPNDYRYLNDNLGNAYILLGEFQKGLTFLKNNAVLHVVNDRYRDLAWNYNQMVSAYIKLEELDSAKLYLNLIESLPKNSMSLETLKDILYLKSLVAIETKELDSLETFVNQFYSLSDSLVTAKTNSNIKDAQTKYEVEKKEAALKLSEEESAKLTAENTAKNRLLLLGLAVFIILLLLAIYFYRNFKQKEKLQALEVEVKNAELDELLSNQETQAFESILKGQEKERERIAQDLHDRLGGTLAALKLSLRKPQYEIEQDDLSIIDNAVNEVRSIAHNLSTGLVHKYGLNEAVNQLFRTLEQTRGIKFTVYLHKDIGELGQTIGIELYRIVQELVSNTLKHAQANEVSLQTNFSEGVFNLIYEDNGVGFDVLELKGGIGLENIRDRVNRIGGELHIDAAKGRGSIFIIELKA